MKLFLAGALVLGIHGATPAQTMRPVLTLDTASRARDTCIAWAKERKLNLAIAVHDESGRLMTFARMDGASTAVSDIAMWKSRSAATYRYSSADTAKWNNPSFPGIATGGGGVPIFTVDGQALGAIGVSGAQAEEDIACAEAGIGSVALKSKKAP